MTKVLSVLSFAAFHAVFLSRIDALNPMDESSVPESKRIADDACTTKVPADRILGIQSKLQGKMAEVIAADSSFVEQTYKNLETADGALAQQIQGYIDNGDLSDTVTTTMRADDDLSDKSVAAATAEQVIAAAELGNHQTNGAGARADKTA